MTHDGGAGDEVQPTEFVDDRPKRLATKRVAFPPICPPNQFIVLFHGASFLRLVGFIGVGRLASGN
jgi:hypothetical protein